MAVRLKILSAALGVLALCAGAAAQTPSSAGAPAGGPQANAPAPQEMAKNSPAPLAGAKSADAPADPAKATVAPEAAAANPAPAKPAKPHKVITNDDIDAAHAHAAGKIGDQKLAPPIFGGALCDEECARIAHDRSGISEEDEGEWQMQLATARRNLAADSAWLRAYGNATQKTKMLCDFLTQQANTPVPTGNDYWARVDQYKHEQYVENMGRTLSQGVESANNQIQQLIQAVEPIEPVRAEIMGVISYQIQNSCPRYLDP